MVLALHIIFVCGTTLVVLYGDELAFEWVRGIRKTIPKRLLWWLHRLVAAGLIGLLATGTLLALPRLHYLLNDPVFYTKMVFVGALVINGAFIEGLATRATTHTFKSLSRQHRTLLLISGLVSAVGWAGAIICGLLLG